MIDRFKSVIDASNKAGSKGVINASKIDGFSPPRLVRALSNHHPRRHALSSGLPT